MGFPIVAIIECLQNTDGLICSLYFKIIVALQIREDFAIELRTDSDFGFLIFYRVERQIIYQPRASVRKNLLC